MGRHRKKHRNAAERREPGGYVAMPHCMLSSQNYISLSPHALKLLGDLLAQFKGSNNGNLCMAWTLMEKRNWKSRDTLNKARRELLEKEFIIMSRAGDRKRPTLYAVTFFAIDECGGKLDINATERPLSLWRKHEPVSPLNINSVTRSASQKAVNSTCSVGHKTPNMEYRTPSVS